MSTEDSPTLTGTSPTPADEVSQADLPPDQAEPTFIAEAGTTEETLRAVRSVTLWTIQDAFDLVAAEVLWASYQLSPIFDKLHGREPVGIPASVRQELLHQTYSKKLNLTRMDSNEESRAVYRDDVLNADLTDWAAVLTDLIRVTYDPRPIEVEEIRGRITGILRELGVGDEVDPRGSLYLPNVILDRLTKNP